MIRQEHIKKLIVLKNYSGGAGTMALWLKALAALAEDPKFSSQQPHGGT